MGTTRAEHMQWAKARALECADRGERELTIASMISDLGKHPETAPLQQVATLAAMTAGNTPADLRHWVEGFAS